VRRFSSPRRRLAAVLSGLALVLAGAVACSNASADPKTAPPLHWSAVWKADFTGAYQAAPDASVWKINLGHGIFGNGEIETMTNNPGNVYLDGHGNLDITAVGQGDSWTSGRLQTNRMFGAPAGGEMMVSAEIQQPNPASGLGYWPAFWMLGTGVWPAHGEIDIMEDANAISQHSGTLHCGTDPGGPCNETTGLSSDLQACANCQTGYHDYSVIIDRRQPGAEQIRWYLDGTEFYHVDEAKVGAAAWTTAVDGEFTIILDIAMGGSYPDNQCGCSAPNGATTAGGTMSVRKLAVYDGTTSGS
jgi:beta-glucanase (GH16 family)